MRLFFAIPISEEIKDLLEDLILLLEKRNPRSQIKWIERNNLYLTLAFIENFPEEKIPELIQKVKKIKTKPDFWLLKLGELGFFPPKGQAKIFKLSVEGEIEKLQQLQLEIKDILRAFSVAVDDKPFIPHLTLGRIRSQRGHLSKKVDFENLSFGIKNFQLLESKIINEEQQYQILFSF